MELCLDQDVCFAGSTLLGEDKILWGWGPKQADHTFLLSQQTCLHLLMLPYWFVEAQTVFQLAFFVD